MIIVSKELVINWKNYRTVMDQFSSQELIYFFDKIIFVVVDWQILSDFQSCFITCTCSIKLRMKRKIKNYI